MRQLDETDRAIVARLQYDGRMPFTEIADELGLSEGAVRRRVKRMTDEGVLQIVAIVEPQFLDWQTACMIGVSVQAGRVEAAAQQIAQFPEVTYLFMASGGFDLFVEVYCRDRAHFVSFLNQRLQKVPGIERTETFMILKMYKLSYRWGEAEPPRTRPKSPGGPGEKARVPVSPAPAVAGKGAGTLAGKGAGTLAGKGAGTS
jgi:Lrp/AsnC family transcriptional regulator for asnA, asnC and gidA